LPLVLCHLARHQTAHSYGRRKPVRGERAKVGANRLLATPAKAKPYKNLAQQTGRDTSLILPSGCNKTSDMIGNINQQICVSGNNNKFKTLIT
jgi:hypothetical protein